MQCDTMQCDAMRCDAMQLNHEGRWDKVMQQGEAMQRGKIMEWGEVMEQEEGQGEQMQRGKAMEWGEGRQLIGGLQLWCFLFFFVIKLLCMRKLLTFGEVSGKLVSKITYKVSLTKNRTCTEYSNLMRISVI